MATLLRHKPSTNTAATKTIALIATDTPVEIEGIHWSYSADPTGGNLKIESPSGTTIYDVDITNGGPGFLPFSGSCLKGAKGQAVIVTLAAGGLGIQGIVNIFQRD